MNTTRKKPKGWDEIVTQLRERVEAQDTARHAGWGGSALIGVDLTLAQARYLLEVIP